ncbi:MAG: tetratricopeptide repeat protein [Rhodospirillaceae bacterium]
MSQSIVPEDSKVPSQVQLSSLLEHYKNGRFGDAEKMAISITQEFPKHQFGWKVLGAVLGQTGRKTEAADVNQKAVELSPDDAEAHSNLGVTLQELGKLDEAEASLRQAIALTPDYAEAHSNLGVTLQELGKLDEAEASYRQAIALTPDYAEAHSNLGIMLKELGKLDEAEASLRQAIALTPDYAEAHNNLGVTLQELGRLDEAEASYRQAIALTPDYAQAHFNLGITIQELGRLDEAEASLRQAIVLKPGFAEAHNNLGITLKELGRSDEAEVSLRQAIALKSDYVRAHSNLGITLQALGRLEEAEISYTQAITLESGFAEGHFNLGNMLREQARLEEAETSYTQAIVLKSDYVKAQNNLGVTLNELGKPDKSEMAYSLMLKSKSERVSNTRKSRMVALIPFGRSGSLFFHSLIDGHPEVSTLPGVYFKGWFGLEVWRKFAPDFAKSDWREHLVKTIVREFQPLFDARCKNNVIGNPWDRRDWLAKDSGFTDMGPDRSQSFLVDQNSFCREFLILLNSFSSIGISECFELIHRAFDISVRGKSSASCQENNNIFYHIHNPNTYEHLHFLKHYPQARFLQLIRNPIQSMESWMLVNSQNVGVLSSDNTSDKTAYTLSIVAWRKVVAVILTMFLQMLSPLINRSNNCGVRLEDIKRNPHELMPKIAAWMGVKDHPELYKSRFCGLEYWGPASKETGKITGFDTRAIDKPVGRLLGVRDILIFETLFWPLAKKYSYTQMDDAEFRLRLAEIRPWLDEPLEFENRFYDEMVDHGFPLEQLAPYVRLHQFMHVLWKTLDRDETYIGIPKRLEFN